MVRVGGGWDTLQHYLYKHDQCRQLSQSHKMDEKKVFFFLSIQEISLFKLKLFSEDKQKTNE